MQLFEASALENFRSPKVGKLAEAAAAAAAAAKCLVLCLGGDAHAAGSSGGHTFL